MDQDLKKWWDNLSVNWKSVLQHIYPINLEIFEHENIYKPSFTNQFKEFNIDENSDDFWKYQLSISSVNTLLIGWQDIDYPDINLQVENLEPLSKFVSLEALWLFSDIVLDYHFGAPSNLTNIKAIELQTRNLQNLEFCINYYNLEYLVVRDALGLSSLHPLRNLNKLKYLNVSDSNVYSIECLMDKNISYLDITNTLVPLREVTTFNNFNPNCFVRF